MDDSKQKDSGQINFSLDESSDIKIELDEIQQKKIKPDDSSREDENESVDKNDSKKESTEKEGSEKDSIWFYSKESGKKAKLSRMDLLLMLLIVVLFLWIVIFRNRSVNNTYFQHDNGSDTASYSDDSDLNGETNALEKSSLNKNEYYLVTNIRIVNRTSNQEYNDNFEYILDRGQVIVPYSFCGDLMHPEYENNELQFFDKDGFIPNHLFRWINKYTIRTYVGVAAEEKLEFDEAGRLSKISIDSQGTRKKNFISDSMKINDDNTYSISLDGEEFEYTEDGVLTRYKSDRNCTSEYVYDGRRRQVSTKVNAINKECYLDDNITIRYDELGESAQVYHSAEGFEESKLYYDERGFCYKKETDFQDIYYEYMKVTIDENNRIQVVEDKINVIDYTDDSLSVNEIKFKEVLDDYEKAFESIKNDDYDSDEVLEEFYEKYSIENNKITKATLGTYEYMFRDIDGDGEDEMFVQSNDSGFSAFTIKDKKVYNIINGGDKKSVFLLNDNTFLVMEMGKNHLFIYSIYVLDETGTKAVVKEQYIMGAMAILSAENKKDFDISDFNNDKYWFYSTDDDEDIYNDTYSTYDEAVKFLEDKENKIEYYKYTSFRNYEYKISKINSDD